jgi:hypothetical protein
VTPDPERTPDENESDGIEAPPPVLGSWRNLYALVLGALAVQVLVYWVVTQVYAP